ncbi:MAG: cytochrome c biogenesis heme-transporting ATPase CcmA [Burkholderiales bacterium]|nr:cytochrome c biogenesis heme-transporting ATPase CcmA [Burkholderiales bacterium]
MLSAARLECRRGRRRLFSEVSFALPAGRALLVSGRNGAGKTTLLRALCGLTRPEVGEVAWRGRAVRDHRDEYHAELVFLGHHSALKDDLTPEENLRCALELGGDDGAAHVAATFERLGLAACARLPVRSLSQGQRRRAALARLWLSRARPLWILDEPFVALDAESTATLAGLLRAHVDGGGALVYTTHQEIDVAPGRTERLALGD